MSNVVNMVSDKTPDFCEIAHQLARMEYDSMVINNPNIKLKPFPHRHSSQHDEKVYAACMALAIASVRDTAPDTYAKLCNDAGGERQLIAHVIVVTDYREYQ